MNKFELAVKIIVVFPSPTGVNYYEFSEFDNVMVAFSGGKGFRPQQGLTIMNSFQESLQAII